MLRLFKQVEYELQKISDIVSVSRQYQTASHWFAHKVLVATSYVHCGVNSLLPSSSLLKTSIASGARPFEGAHSGTITKYPGQAFILLSEKQRLANMPSFTSPPVT